MQQTLSKAFSWYSINIFKILFYTCCIALVILFAERLFIIFSYEAHTAGIDNNFDYPIIRSLAGYSMYPNPSAYPYAVNPYAPLFFILCKWTASLLQVAASDTISIYRISRSVALLADSGSCILLFLILRRQVKASQNVSIAATALFFSILCLLGYTINRSDSLFLFFYGSTLYVLLKSHTSESAARALICSILATLCIFSKQNGISLLMLVPVWFIMEKNYRHFIQFVFFTLIFCSGTFLYFEYFYTNHFFSKHIINALKNNIDARWFYIYVFKLIADSYLTIPLAISFVISVKSISENNNQLLKKTGTLFILQFLFSTALCLKWGSSLGYYNESFLLGFIIMTVFYTGIVSTKRTSFIATTGIYIYPALLLFIFHIIAQLFFFFINNRAEARKKFDEQVQISNYIKREIGKEDRYVIDLSNPDFNFFKNILYKESAVPNIDAVHCCTLPGKIFDYSGLLNGLQTGKILFLIKEKSALEKTIWGADIRHYKEDSSFSSYRIYKYNASGLKR